MRSRIVETTDLPTPDALSDALSLGALGSLRSTRIWPWQRGRYVVRTRRHTVAWMKTWLVTETEELRDEFVTGEKWFTSRLLRYEDEVRLAFRLRTRGLEGWTE